MLSIDYLRKILKKVRKKVVRRDVPQTQRRSSSLEPSSISVVVERSERGFVVVEGLRGFVRDVPVRSRVIDASAGGSTREVAVAAAAAGHGTAAGVIRLEAVRVRSRLAGSDARQERIVESRFFGGLTIEETAEVLKISPATVKREWRMAKAWLYRELA